MKHKKVKTLFLTAVLMLGISIPVNAAGTKTEYLSGTKITGKTWITGTTAYGRTDRDGSGNVTVKIAYKYVPKGSDRVVTNTRNAMAGGSYVTVNSTESADYMLEVSGTHTMTITGGSIATIYT